MQHPNNEPFDRPPALATRSSTSDVFTSPDLRSKTTVRRTIPSSLIVSHSALFAA